MRTSCEMENTDESNSLPGSPAKLKTETSLDPTYFKRKDREEEKKRRSAQFNTGRWTTEEHDLFLEALRIDGKDWDLIEQHVKTRDAAHIRSHAQKFFSKLVRFIGGEEMENPIQDAAVYLEILQRKVEKPHRKKTKASGLQEASHTSQPTPDSAITDSPDEPKSVSMIFKVTQDPVAIQKKNAISNIQPSNMVNDANEFVDQQKLLKEKEFNQWR